jgi:hypothetical protein
MWISSQHAKNRDEEKGSGIAGTLPPRNEGKTLASGRNTAGSSRVGRDEQWGVSQAGKRRSNHKACGKLTRGNSSSHEGDIASREAPAVFPIEGSAQHRLSMDQRFKEQDKAAKKPTTTEVDRCVSRSEIQDDGGNWGSKAGVPRKC